MSHYGYAEFFANYIDQILELVVDEDLEDEIEQADIFRERLQRTIMDAENSTEVKKNPSMCSVHQMTLCQQALHQAWPQKVC